MADPFRTGGELGPVLDAYLGTEGIKHEQGGASDRTSALADAVAGALGPFVTEYYE